MRPILAATALSLIAVAPAARAQMAQYPVAQYPAQQDRLAQDRYDSPGPDRPLPAAGATLRGPKSAGPIRANYLTWTGKVDPLRGAQGDGDLRGPALLDTATGRAVRGANSAHWQDAPPVATTPAPIPAPALRPSVASAPPQPAPYVSSAPTAPVASGRPQRLPSSLYDQGYVDPAAPPPLAGAAPQAQNQAQNQGQAPTQTASQSGPRYYSLVREYGLTPDPIPPATPSVLALSPTVAQAMADDKDDGPPIDLAGEDQADSAPPAHNYNYNSSSGSSSSGSSTTSTNANGQTTSTYVVR